MRQDRASVILTLLPTLLVLIACANSKPAPAPQAVPPASTTPSGVSQIAPTPVPKTISLSDLQQDQALALIRKAVDAAGGAAVVDGVKTLELRGKSIRKFPSGQAVDFASATYLMFPDRYRQEANLSMGQLVTVWTPQGAFTDMGDGPVLLPEGPAGNMEQGFRRNMIGLLKSRTEPGFRAAAKGPEKTPSGASVELVEITAGARTTTLGIDATGKVLMTRWAGRIGPGGEAGDTVTEFSDFRAIGGLTYPFALAATQNGKPTHEVHLETVTVNGEMDPSLFEPKGVPVPVEAVPTPTPTPAPPG